MEQPQRPKRLNPAVMAKIIEKHTFQKPPLGFGKAANAGRTPLDALKAKYQVMLLDEKWNQSFVELLHSLKHVSIGCGFEGFYVSAVADSMFTEKKLGVDPELLHYLFKHLGVHFESLRISATHVEGADGKLLPATTAAVDSGIQGLSSLAFESYPITEEEFEQLLADAETIVQRNGATLRKLKCSGNGARFAKMLPPTAALASLEVRLDDYNSRLGYTLEEIATVLRANATSIQLTMETACEGVEYTAGEATACRKLKLVRGNVQEGGVEELEALLKCIAAVGTRLESAEVVLDGHSANEGTVADFFSFVDERITQYAKTIQSVAFRCSTTVRANVHLTYLDAQTAADFVDRFKASYPNVSTGAEEESTEEPTSWTLDRSVDLGEGRTLRIDASVEPLDDEDLLREMYEDNLDYELDESADDFDLDAADEWDDDDGLDVDYDDEY